MYREPTVKEGNWNSNQWFRAEGRNKTFNKNCMEKQEFKKMRRGLGTSRTTLNVPTSES